MHPLSPYWEKAMAPHSSTLAWKIPWMEESGGPQSMGSLRVGHDWATSLALFTFMQWRRKRQPTPVFLPGESQGRRSPVGCRLWGRTELWLSSSSGGSSVPLKVIAPHSSALAWKIPRAEEPGGLQSMGPQRVRHDWVPSVPFYNFFIHSYLSKQFVSIW